MTTKQRAGLGFDNAFENFDATAYAPKAKPEHVRPDRAETRKAAEKVGFVSRDPVKPIEAAPARKSRQKTGRTEQLNIRAKTETKEAFHAVASAQGWSDAVTLEKAVELLTKQYTR